MVDVVTDRRLGRYLGLAFLVVWAGSILSGAMSASIFADNPAETLTNIAEHSAQMRWSTMIELCVTSVGIVVLAVLLYVAVGLFSSVLFLAADVDWFFLGFPTGLFELVIGVWLIAKGINRTDLVTIGAAETSVVT